MAKQDDSAALVVLIFGFFGVLALLVVSSVVNGFVLSTLWGWFLVPTLGVPDIGIASAIGMSMLLAYVTYQYDSKNDKKTDWFELVLTTIMRPVLALGVGWVVKGFM